MRTGTILLTALLLLFAASSWAQDLRNLTAEELKKKIDQREKILVVDTRTAEEYRQAHIPTAINIPPPQFASIQNHLPKDKRFPIVFYCRGYS